MGSQNAQAHARSGNHSMIDISAEQINLHSPYAVERIDCNSFVFNSQHGIKFNVGFAEDYMFMEEGAYQLFICNLSETPSPNDPLVKETVSAIIREFFSQEPAVILYICDTSDERQAIRNRLFSYWFTHDTRNEEFTMLHETVIIDDISYYGSLLMRKDHPLHDSIVREFHDFATTLPDKLNNL